MLQIKNITKKYTTGDFVQIALDKVTLNFKENEFVSILGPSGSGKTTFLNIIGGLDRYDTGDLIINGKSTSDFKEKEWDAYRNNSIGFIFQSYNLIFHLNIIDNIEMSMTLSGVSKNIKREKSIEALEKVGLKEHMYKKPNQLSGGQMQRIAIARALVNNPDIILADEPTGALDSKTSVQIMELIKEISKNKLVIMVTHNPELANKYSDRIVNFKDGKVKSDTKPVDEKEIKSNYKLKKTSMSFLTALKLSGKNIQTKKGRTALTAIASSIGIIGIAIILSLSNGFDKQIDYFESSTLSSFPIIVNKSHTEVDIESLEEDRENILGLNDNDENKYPNIDHVYPSDEKKRKIIHENKITNEYIDYITNIDKTLASGIGYSRYINMNILRSDGDKINKVNTSNIGFSSYPTGIGDNKNSFLQSQYDLIAGEYPSKLTDIILMVDEFNRIDNSILKELGIDYNQDKINFNEIINKEFKVIMNDDYYINNGQLFTANISEQNLKNIYNSENSLTLRISGIIRANKDNKFSILQPGISYSDELSKYFIENAKNSEIVKKQLSVNYNVFTGEQLKEIKDNYKNKNNIPETKDEMIQMLGGETIPNIITVYPTNFSSKEKIISYLDKWNIGKNDSDKIIYNDLAKTFSGLSSGIMDAITIVLIAFASISLVVSLIMVGIITYISVLERRKEIGILRALGARKKDITRVFNAETFIIGSCSGIIGITIAYISIIPINMLLLEITKLSNVAILNPIHAILLIIISVTLTVLGGLIPSKIAAKKDPVQALRSE